MSEYSYDILLELQEMNKHLRSISTGMSALFDDSQSQLSNTYDLNEKLATLLQMTEDANK